jgi:hypothetical protein
MLQSGVSVEKSRFTTGFLSLLVSWLFSVVVAVLWFVVGLERELRRAFTRDPIYRVGPFAHACTQ